MGSRSNRQAGLIPSIIDPTNQNYTGIPGLRHERRRLEAKAKEKEPYVPDHGPGGGAMRARRDDKKSIFRKTYTPSWKKGKG